MCIITRSVDLIPVWLGSAPENVNKEDLLSLRAEAGQGNIRKMHKPKPIQPEVPSEDKVAVLWPKDP